VRIADRKGNVGIPDNQRRSSTNSSPPASPPVVISFGSPYLIERFPPRKPGLRNSLQTMFRNAPQHAPFSARPPSPEKFPSRFPEQ
jgi:hypothetical protein